MTFEIRPHPAVGVRGANVRGLGVNRSATNWRLVVDPDGGTVEWWDKEEAGSQYRMRLPGRGPTDLPELATLAFVDTFDVREAPSGELRWLIFVGADGRAIMPGKPEQKVAFRALFDDDAFGALEQYGVRLETGLVGSSAEMGLRYPGSLPRARRLLYAHPWLFVVTVVVAVCVIFVVIVNANG